MEENEMKESITPILVAVLLVLVLSLATVLGWALNEIDALDAEQEIRIDRVSKVLVDAQKELVRILWIGMLTANSADEVMRYETKLFKEAETLVSLMPPWKAFEYMKVLKDTITLESLKGAEEEWP